MSFPLARRAVLAPSFETSAPRDPFAMAAAARATAELAAANPHQEKERGSSRRESKDQRFRQAAQRADSLKQASRSALRFIAESSRSDKPEELVSLPSGIALGRVDSLTPALALSWLPQLSREVKEGWMQRLEDFRETPSALLFDGPPQLEAHASTVLARWRMGGHLDHLRRDALLLLGSSLHTAGRRELDPAQSAWFLLPFLLAVRLARLPIDRTFHIPVGRWRRRVRPSQIVERYMKSLGTYLLEADLHQGTEASPTPEWILCLGTELWRQTTPWSADLRAPLEIATWDRWRRLRYAEDLDPLALSALLIAAENLHIDVDLVSLRWRLAALQADDGGFAASPLLTIHPGPRHLGSRTLTTILACRALLGQPRTSGAWSPPRTVYPGTR